MEAIALWGILIGLVLIAGVSSRLRNTIITLPMLYTLFGLGVGLLFRDHIQLSFDSPLVETILILALSLAVSTEQQLGSGTFFASRSETNPVWHFGRPANRFPEGALYPLRRQERLDVEGRPKDLLVGPNHRPLVQLVWQTHSGTGQERCGRFGNEAGARDANTCGNASSGSHQQQFRRVINMIEEMSG